MHWPRAIARLLPGEARRSIDPPPVAEPISQEAGIEYIKAMLEYARDDARQVYLRVTAALAVAALVLTQIPFEQLQRLETAPTVALLVGLALLVIAAILHHSYLARIHHTRVAIAKCLPTIATATAKELGPPSWDHETWRLRLGDVLMGVAGVLLAVVVAVLVA